MRLSAEAMNAALADFQPLQYSTQDASAYEAFLASIFHPVPIPA